MDNADKQIRIAEVVDTDMTEDSENQHTGETE